MCRTDIARLRAGARICGDACRNVLPRLLRSWRRPRRGERALVYSIPNRRNPSRPYAKGVNVSDWEQAYEQLMSTGSLEYSWFRSSMAECCKSGACNFTTIGGVFVLLGIAVRLGRGVYRKA